VDLEVISLAFAVHVGEEEDTEDDGDKIPSGEDKSKGVFLQDLFARVKICTNGDESGNLQEADL